MSLRARVVSVLLVFSVVFGGGAGSPRAGAQFDPGAAKKRAAELARKAQRTAKRTLAQLTEEGRKKPTALRVQKGRRSSSKLSAPAALGLRVELSDAALVRLRERYAALEATASAALKAELADIAREVKKKRWSFEVGVTSVSEQRPMLMKGIGGKRKRPAGIPMQHAAESVNGYERQRLARALPPVRFSAPNPDEDENDDEAIPPPPAGPVEPERVAGTKGAQYPSSAFLRADARAFSWRDKLGPARSQGDCGSCWAFAVLAAAEGGEAAFNHRDLDLAEQYAVNCVPVYAAYQNNCDGQYPSVLAEFLLANAAPTERSMPYVSGRDVSVGTCPQGLTPAYRLKAWGAAGARWYDPTVEEIKEALVSHGPVATWVYVDDRYFFNYRGGVYDADLSGYPNHAVTIVGWDDDRRAFHVRNSWGEGWGEEGYMWIRYGASSIGYDALWVDPEPAPEPEERRQFQRYVRLENRSDGNVRVHVRLETAANDKWVWKPAASDKKPWRTWTLKPGQKYTLRGSDKKLLSARKLRIWAETEDGKESWTVYRDKDLPIVKRFYRAPKRETRVIVLPFKAEPPPTPDELMTTAHEERVDGKLAEARSKFERFVALYPEHELVHEARYWTARTLLDEGQYEQAAVAYYAMLSDVPDKDPLVAYGHYDIAIAYLSLGECGYARRNFEVVANATLPVDKSWATEAKRWLAKLKKDKGQLCASWE